MGRGGVRTFDVELIDRPGDREIAAVMRDVACATQETQVLRVVTSAVFAMD